jgi:hypothetical protein
MKITATQTFLDDRDRYEEGEEYEVDDTKAGYFIGNGWAQGPDGYTGPGSNQEVTLDIQSSSHDHNAESPEGGGSDR